MSVTCRPPLASRHLYKAGAALGDAGNIALSGRGIESGAKYHHNPAAMIATKASSQGSTRPTDCRCEMKYSRLCRGLFAVDCNLRIGTSDLRLTRLVVQGPGCPVCVFYCDRHFTLQQFQVAARSLAVLGAPGGGINWSRR